MEFRTIVDIEKPGFEIQPCEELLLVGSCFADAIGQHFREEGFPVTVNPYGTMYNPASVLHTVERFFSTQTGREKGPRMVFFTLGTNHVYRLKETGEIVDNCQKRPAALFQEEQLTVEACADYLRQAVDVLRQHHQEVQVVMTVSPIRYRKYGYHESQLSKATLLLAVQQLLSTGLGGLYIWQRLVDTCFSPQAKDFLEEWRPLKQVLAHKPFNPEGEAYKQLMDKTMLKVAHLRKKYPTFAL